MSVGAARHDSRKYRGPRPARGPGSLRKIAAIESIGSSTRIEGCLREGKRGGCVTPTR
jgi:hypothetical protein